ncbi:MAG: hypothetical protein JSU05_08220 [Bacteroidetes bacterium]|nr:hypothetical protein [Bacteroidota bacterium]
MKHLMITLGFFFFILFADAQGKTQSFTSTGTYKFIVPKAVTSIKVVLWGAGGWGGGASGSLSGTGGKGGYVSGSINVKEGDSYIIIVGKGGSMGSAGAITAIKKDTSYLAIAAAGGNGSSHGGKGGNAGTLGMSGSIGGGSFQSGNSGTGATVSQGGTGGRAGSSGINGTNGTALTGGKNNARSAGEGWGGAGWFGGGAAGTYNSMFISNGPYASGGGGGGSNLTRGLTGSIVSSANGNIGGIGNNAGINGKIMISWK